LVSAYHINDASYAIEVELFATVRRKVAIKLSIKTLIANLKAGIDVGFFPKGLINSDTIVIERGHPGKNGIIVLFVKLWTEFWK
jgi:hypothetical protein